MEPCVKSGLLTLRDRLRPFILVSLYTVLLQNEELNRMEPNICINRGVKRMQYLLRRKSKESMIPNLIFGTVM